MGGERCSPESTACLLSLPLFHFPLQVSMVTQQSPQQTPFPGEEVVYMCIVPGHQLHWRILRETGDRLMDANSADVYQNGFRSTAGVYDVANHCFNSTLTFIAQNGIYFICFTADQSMNALVTVAVQGMWSCICKLFLVTLLL